MSPLGGRASCSRSSSSVTASNAASAAGLLQLGLEVADSSSAITTASGGGLRRRLDAPPSSRLIHAGASGQQLDGHLVGLLELREGSPTCPANWVTCLAVAHEADQPTVAGPSSRSRSSAPGWVLTLVVTHPGCRGRLPPQVKMSPPACQATEPDLPAFHRAPVDCRASNSPAFRRRRTIGGETQSLGRALRMVTHSSRLSRERGGEPSPRPLPEAHPQRPPPRIPPPCQDRSSSPTLAPNVAARVGCRVGGIRVGTTPGGARVGARLAPRPRNPPHTAPRPCSDIAFSVRLDYRSLAGAHARARCPAPA